MSSIFFTKILEPQIFCPLRTGQLRTGHLSTCEFGTGQVGTGQVETDKVWTIQEQNKQNHCRKKNFGQANRSCNISLI